MNTSLEKMVKILKDNGFINMRSVFGECWEFVKQPLAYPYEAFMKN